MAQEIGVAYVSLLPSGRGFSKAVKNEADTAFAGAQKSSNGFFASIGRGLGALVTGAGAIAATVGAIAIGGGISRALNIEDATAKLKGLGHDTKAVDQIMTDALASVKGTAFGLDSAATLAASAVAAGIEPGKELERYLRLTADAATIAGGSMDELGNVMNNVTTVGAAYNDSLQILAQKGLPIYQWLADELGVTTDAVKQLASEGKISAETFQAAIENNIAGAAMSAGDTTRGAFANVGAALSRLGEIFAGPALSGAKNFFDELIVIIDGIAERIEPAVGGINDQLSGMFQFDGLGERVLGFVDSVSGAFSGIGDAFGGLDGLAPVFGAIVGAMAPLLNSLPIIGKLLPAISGPVGAIIGLIAGLLIESEPLRESLSGLADTIGGALSSAFGGAGESLSSFAPMISEILEVLGDGLAEGITAITPAIGVLIEALGQVFEALSPLIEPLMGIVTAVLSLLGPIGELVGAILPPLAELFVLIAGSVADLAGTFLEALLPVIEALVGALGGLIDFLIGVFTGDWEAAWAGLQAMFSGIWDAIVAAVQGIGQILAAVWEGIVAQMSGVVSWLNGVFVGAFTGLVGFFSGIWPNITSGITNAWNGVMSFLGSIPGRIKGFFAGIGTWLLDSGRALIQGFIDGIKGMIGAVGDAVGGVMDWASGFFPHSPALRGPFSGTGWVRVEDGGKSLMEQFAAGADKIRPELKLGALTATAGTLAALAPSTTSTSYAPQITVQSTGKLKDDLEEVAFQLRQMGRGSRR